MKQTQTTINPFTDFDISEESKAIMGVLFKVDESLTKLTDGYVRGFMTDDEYRSMVQRAIDLFIINCKIVRVDNVIS